MSCLGCEQTAQRNNDAYEAVKQQAKKEGERLQIDMVLYQTPEGWQYIRADISAGLPVRDLVFYARPTP